MLYCWRKLTWILWLKASLDGFDQAIQISQIWIPNCHMEMIILLYPQSCCSIIKMMHIKSQWTRVSHTHTFCLLFKRSFLKSYMNSFSEIFIFIQETKLLKASFEQALSVGNLNELILISLFLSQLVTFSMKYSTRILLSWQPATYEEGIWLFITVRYWVMLPKLAVRVWLVMRWCAQPVLLFATFEFWNSTYGFCCEG